MRSIVFTFVFLCCFAATSSRADVRITSLEDRVRVEIDGDLFTEWRYKDWVAPYFYPVIGPTGENITRHYPMKEGVESESQDHPHHRSLRFAHSDVNGLNFWYWRPGRERELSKAEIKVEKIDEIQSGETGSFAATNHWLNDGKLILTEKMYITITPLENRQVLMDYDIELQAPDDSEVVFGDIKDGGLYIRVAGTMKAEQHHKLGGGKLDGTIVNSKGDTNTNAWGKRADWTDFNGPDASGKTVGIAIFDHPDNLRHPTHWHARTYGLLTANRFGQDHFDPKFAKPPKTPCRPHGTECPACNSRGGDYTIPPGDSLRLRHRLYFHHGNAQQAKVADQYTNYTVANWTDLFDGESLNGWRGYRNQDLKDSGWLIKEGMLYNNGAGTRVDLLTTESYQNYELAVEWKTVPDGNGGIFIHGAETTEKLPFNAPEIQLHAPGKRDLDPMSQAGALYALYPARADAIKPAGEWNRTRVICQGSSVEIYHNGLRVCNTVVGGDEWNRKVAGGKFKDTPEFGTRSNGHIGLQDYNREVWFRKIALRKL